jgi:hypothetical protein
VNPRFSNQAAGTISNESQKEQHLHGGLANWFFGGDNSEYRSVAPKKHPPKHRSLAAEQLEKREMLAAILLTAALAMN